MCGRRCVGRGGGRAAAALRRGQPVRDAAGGAARAALIVGTRGRGACGPQADHNSGGGSGGGSSNGALDGSHPDWAGRVDAAAVGPAARCCGDERRRRRLARRDAAQAAAAAAAAGGRVAAGHAAARDAAAAAARAVCRLRGGGRRRRHGRRLHRRPQRAGCARRRPRGRVLGADARRAHRRGRIWEGKTIVFCVWHRVCKGGDRGSEGKTRPKQGSSFESCC